MSKMTIRPKGLRTHKPGDLVRTAIEWHPDGKSATVTHHHMPHPPPKGAQGMMMPSAPSSQDQAYTNRVEALHDVAKHAGVVSEMVDHPEPEDEGEEENEAAQAGVGDTSSKSYPTRKKYTNVFPAPKD